MRPSIDDCEHTKINTSLAYLWSRHIVGGLSAIVHHVTLSL